MEYSKSPESLGYIRKPLEDYPKKRYLVWLMITHLYSVYGSEI